jgi:hypothetical protein
VFGEMEGTPALHRSHRETLEGGSGNVELSEMWNQYLCRRVLEMQWRERRFTPCERTEKVRTPWMS